MAFAIVMFGSFSRVSNVRIQNMEDGVFMGSGNTQQIVEGCAIQNLSGTGIECDGSTVSVIADNMISQCDLDGILVHDAVTHLAITGNVIDQSATDEAGNAGIRLASDGSSDMRLVSIVGNAVESYEDGIVVTPDSIEGLTVSGNTVEAAYTGMVFANMIRSSVSGNVLRGFNNAGNYTIGEFGISITDCSWCSFDNNVIVEPGQFADNTYDGVILAGVSDNNRVTDNQIKARDAGNQTRYAINVSAATCNCNVVVGNSGSDAADFGTDAINDAGTDTWLTYPNDPSYGDNFFQCGATS